MSSNGRECAKLRVTTAAGFAIKQVIPQYSQVAGNYAPQPVGRPWAYWPHGPRVRCCSADWCSASGMREGTS
jgi:hypothetical protein